MPPKYVTLKQALLNPAGYWLMGVYSYEELTGAIMEDHTFDQLARWLNQHYDAVLNPHIGLIDRQHTKGSLGLQVPMWKLPTRIFCATHRLMDQVYGAGKWGVIGRSYKDMLDTRFHPALM